MNCPQCGNQWDASKGPCARCGFTPRLSQPLSPDTSLRSGRYRLQKIAGQQSWNSGIVEMSWLGRDLRKGSTSVIIYEVFMPGAHSPAVQEMLRNSARSLLAVGGHPGIPTLQDVFTERERAFFVFEPLRGESIRARLQHLKRPLAEREVVTFCIQMTEILELLASQSPPLVHGRIDPEHIHLSYDGSRCTLSDLSPVIAMGVKPLILEMIQAQSWDYIPSEFAQSQVDTGGDLSSLIATAYYAVTGIVPAASGGAILHAQHLNPAVSSEFAAVLVKGLHPVPQQRYQHAAELREELLAIRARMPSGNLLEHDQANEPGSSTRFASGTRAPGMSALLTKDVNGDEERILLPAPEVLPPMREGNAFLEAIAILAIIFLSLGITTVLSNFHV